jgi:hypothetical protein
MNNQVQSQQDNQAQDTFVAAPQGDFEIIDGVACPIDPFEREMCDSCQ